MAPPTENSTQAYDEHSIQLIEGLDAVRKRPGMYIGGTGSEGLHHLVWEIVDNAVDEAAAGFCNLIEVTLHKDRSVEVSDNGRGIPTGKKDAKRTALEYVFTELHAGGKFGSGAYSASGGLHGVGASVVNALATKLIVEVDREGQTHRLCFNERKPGRFGPNGGFKATSELEIVKKVPPKRTGTRVRFWPDNEIFDPDAVIEYSHVRDHVAQVCFLVPGLKVRLIDKRGSEPREPEEFVAKGGLSDYVDFLSIGEPVSEIVTIFGSGSFTEKVPVDGKMTDVTRSCQVDVALRWVKGYDTTLVSFVNTIPTREGGTHVAGFERAMTKVVNDVLLSTTKKLAKLAKQGKDRAEKTDVQEGMVAAVKVTFAEPQFKGQTKGELGTPAVQNIVYEAVKDGLTNWIEGGGRKTHVVAVRDKIAQAVINRVSTKQNLDAKRKAANLGSTGMPDKLADCRTHGMGSELLLVEGDSAAGPAKAGRNSEFMAVLPLRGKVVNAGKSNLKQVIENAEAQALITAIGAGSGRDFNLADARYGRIIILCDADVDGSHIRCLLLTLIYHYMRPMLEDGRVFAAQPPLFTTKIGDQKYHAYSDEDKERLTVELCTGNRKRENLTWVRFKGLGEMDVEELAESCLDPETRILRRITMEDALLDTKAGEMFETLMGADVARRRQFLLDNSSLVDPEMLDV
ncbi:MAG TPA: DNA topoisomerase IV subunit B [Microthrixaceae bacterium]|jgi:DNA gyrase subunit B|nr:DNA topoisomerase IV subunit B [Microthrixaceae bacterium]HQF92791.1 DNA topoisomerase IV subunit B [Microthrixaceae bacterium]